MKEVRHGRVIANLGVADPVAHEQYKPKAPALIQKHGGQYIGRGGKFAVCEGDRMPTRLGILGTPGPLGATLNACLGR